jgi:hypothetical protein
MLGRLPWLAFERRSLALRFLVFFDMGYDDTGHSARWHRAHQVRPRVRTYDLAEAHSVSSATSHVLMIRSSGTFRSAARSHPRGCHSSWPVE